MLHRRAKDSADEKDGEKNGKYKESSSQILGRLNLNKGKDKEKKEIKQFADNFHDSSDEEDIDDKVSHYDIQASWKKAGLKSKSKGTNTLNDDQLLSFVAHAAGLKILYSDQVNQLYYPLKQEILRNKNDGVDSVSQLQQLIKHAILMASKQAMDKATRFLSITEQCELSAKQIQKKSQQAIDQFTASLDELIQTKFDIFVDWIKHSRFCHANDEFEELTEFEQELTELFSHTFMQEFSLNKAKFDRDEIKITLSDLAKDKMTSLFSDLEFSKKANNNGKNEAIALLDQYKGPYKHLIRTVKEILIACPARGIVQNLILKKIEEKRHADELRQAYIEDLIDIRKKKKLSAKEGVLFKKYFTCNSECLCDELSSQFHLFFHENMESAKKSFYRPTLGRNHLFASHDPYQFYANLRLSNRSQKRNILNLQSSIYKDDTSSRTWRLTEKSIPEADVAETQRILNMSFGRKDVVEGLGNYEKVYEAIVQLKSYFADRCSDINDASIAQWIRDTFKGKLPDFDPPKIDQIVIQAKLQSIAYLLFGCESTRNPAMIVINQMLLDLIIENPAWSFEEAFTGEVRRMPMSPEGAVAIARSLERDYRDNMPYSYCYHGVFDKTDSKLTKCELIQFEARVVREWICTQVAKPTRSETSRLAEWILNLIENHIEDWLGFPTDITARIVNENPGANAVKR